MPHRRPDEHRDGGAVPDEHPEPENGRVYDLKAFAARYVLLGIDGQYVTVRRKADGAVGRLRYQRFPVYFFEFQPSPERPRRTGA